MCSLYHEIIDDTHSLLDHDMLRKSLNLLKNNKNIYKEHYKKTLKQIQEKKYAIDYEDDYDEVLCYGISFYKKRCLIKLFKLIDE